MPWRCGTLPLNSCMFLVQVLMLVQRSTRGCARDINVPVLMVGGWYDVNTDQVIATFEALLSHSGDTCRRHSRLLIGPWDHHGVLRGNKNVGMLEFRRSLSLFLSFSLSLFLSLYLSFSLSLCVCLSHSLSLSLTLLFSLPRLLSLSLSFSLFLQGRGQSGPGHLEIYGSLAMWISRGR